jgi:mannan endo-1,4-beta-mannosidase
MHLRRVVFLLILAGLNARLTSSQEPALRDFIAVSGGRLMEGDKEFRFISMNVPNLLWIEDELEFTRAHPYRLPDAFEIRDALLTVKAMGGNVARAYTIPVRRGGDPSDVPVYVLGAGQFDETAFRTLDVALAEANATGVRLIIPLLNNWKWMGGVPDYAVFRCKAEYEFWSDAELRADFKATIAHVLTRTNTVTGVPYRDDKAILAWETGNELMGPATWTREMAAYIKGLDPNHLVMDGFNAQGERLIRQESLDDPSIDIVSSHHYEPTVGQAIETIRNNLELVAGRKAYVLGELGFLKTDACATRPSPFEGSRRHHWRPPPHRRCSRSTTRVASRGKARLVPSPT